MSSTEQLYMILVLGAFAGFIVLAAFLTLSQYLYDRRTLRQSHGIGEVISMHREARAA
jgi:hypothetical protein